MEYRKFGQDYAVRLQKGEEILSSLLSLCEREKIRVATVSGLGAVGNVTLGVFDRDENVYKKVKYAGDFEISSCVGNVTTMKGEPYLHLHMVIGSPAEDICASGHLNEGYISLTGEFFLHSMEGTVEREYDESLGINLMKFSD